MLKYNPFRPNNIVGPGMFAGRWEEMLDIEQSLFQTKNNNPKHFLMQGERGIGKSSLMFSAHHIGTGDLHITDGVKFNFLVLPLELKATTSHLDLLKGIGGALKSELVRRGDLQTVAVKVWDFVSKWKILGVEFKREDSAVADPREVFEEVCWAFSQLLNDVQGSVDGILILIDEADKPNEEANLGEFCKLFSEKMTRIGDDRVCLGLAGLPNTLAKLKASHDSSPRVFETITLEPLLADEAKQVIHRGLDIAKGKNGFETSIDEKALQLIADLSEGYPHFIQQFGYSAFEQDSDNRISVEDVSEGAFKANGALDQLGKKYFNELYFDKIASPDYRRVLNSMADHGDQWIQRKEIVKMSGVKDSQVNNALIALRQRGIILLNEQQQGMYRLPTKSFAAWIRALNEKQKAAERP